MILKIIGGFVIGVLLCFFLIGVLVQIRETIIDKYDKKRKQKMLKKHYQRIKNTGSIDVVYENEKGEKLIETLYVPKDFSLTEFKIPGLTNDHINFSGTYSHPEYNLTYLKEVSKQELKKRNDNRTTTN